MTLMDASTSRATADVLEQQYQYQPLDTTRPSIRLITILPRQEDGEILLSLEHASLAAADDSYTAISYTWGPEKPVHRARVNGQHVLLRENIYRFLRHCCDTEFRKHVPGSLWIDSICIDQSNVPEKNEQVRLMGNIFKQAKEVFVWLGPASESSVLPEYYQKHIAANTMYRTWFDHLYEVLCQGSDAELATVMEEDVRKVLDSIYWTRLWIVQEIALAKRRRIVAGDSFLDLAEILSMHKFRKWCTNLKGNEFTTGHPSEQFRVYENRLARSIARLRLHAGVHALNELVAKFKSQGCTDVRDRIYGLLGMTKWAETFDVNYDHDTGRIAESTLRCIEQEIIEEFDPGSWHQGYDVRGLMQALQLDVPQFLAATGVVEDLERPGWARLESGVWISWEAEDMSTEWWAQLED